MAPPNRFFAPVWTAVYAMIAVSGCACGPNHAFIAAITLAAFSVLGGLGASVGRAGIVGIGSRHLLGAIAMAATAAVGIIFTVSAGWKMNGRGVEKGWYRNLTCPQANLRSRKRELRLHHRAHQARD